MENLIVLGTGLAMVTECYNTCFALEHDGDYLLVDAGGGNGILRQIKLAGVNPARIRNMIVTHAHCDHVLGVVWVLRKLGIMMLNGQYEGIFHIWCHKRLAEIIQAIAGMTLVPKITNLFHVRIVFHQVENDTQAEICGWPITFFDIHSSKLEQYGFWILLDNGKKLCCLGDEPFHPVCQPYVEGSDWLLSEAFCLYSHRERYKPYEKHHATLKEACELAERFGIPNLILWHSEDDHYDKRRELFTEEGQLYYSGNLIVPYDLDCIRLEN